MLVVGEGISLFEEGRTGRFIYTEKSFNFDLFFAVVDRGPSLMSLLLPFEKSNEFR